MKTYLNKQYRYSSGKIVIMFLEFTESKQLITNFYDLNKE